MKTLHVFDVSSFVHAGKVNKNAIIDCGLTYDDSSYRMNTLHCGGASLLWNALKAIPEEDDKVFAVDRKPTRKQDILPQYKQNRKFDVSVQKIKDITEYILRDCGFTVLAGDGYEADDFIYSFVKKFKNNYDRIYIYTGDSDLYFLVDEKVWIRPSSSRAKEINFSNYTYSVRKSEYTPYNSVALLKIISGDVADNIPPCYSTHIDVYMAEAFGDDASKYSDFNEIHELFSAYNDTLALRHLSYVAPLFIDDLQEDVSKPSMERVSTWGSFFKNKYYPRIREEIPESISEQVSQMVREGMNE